MGKILITRDADKSKMMQKFFSEFKQNSFIEFENSFITTYSKLRINTENTYVDNDAFIAGVGTYIYKSEIGKTALKLILEDFTSVEDIQAKINGSFCILLRVKNKIFIFVDQMASYNIYYYSQQNDFIITNTYFHIAKVLAKKNINNFGLIETWLQRSISGITPFSDIFKLMGTNYIEYDNKSFSIRDIKGNKEKRNEAVKLNDLLENLSRSLPNAVKDCGVFMTGGQDSRLVLAVLLAANCNPYLYYGIGNSFDTCTKAADDMIVKKIASRFGLKTQNMNWQDSDDSDKSNYLCKYGELYMLYYMNKNIFSEFEEKISNKFLFFGYFGEIYRNIESITQYKSNLFSLSDFLDDIYLDNHKNIFSNRSYSLYKEEIYKEFETVCFSKGIDKHHITKQEFQKLNTEYRKMWDITMNNFANQFCYSFPLFANADLVEYTEKIPFVDKNNSKLIMKIIEYFHSDLLTIPFFSHIKYKRFNKVTLELKEGSVCGEIKDYIKKYVKNTFIRKYIRIAYYKLMNDKKGELELANENKLKNKYFKEFAKTRIFNYVDCSNFNHENIDIRTLKRGILIDYLINKARE